MQEKIIEKQVMGSNADQAELTKEIEAMQQEINAKRDEIEKTAEKFDMLDQEIADAEQQIKQTQ